jgi:hypothetical protein
VLRREAVFSSLRSQLVFGAVDLELETLFPYSVTSTLCLLPVSISNINLFNCFSFVMVSATALDIVLPNPSIIQSVKPFSQRVEKVNLYWRLLCCLSFLNGSIQKGVNVGLFLI